MQRFEPRLTVELAARHPTLMPEVLAHDVERAWLVLADLGQPYGVNDIALDAYLELLPRYAALQQAEAAHAADHLAHGVSDMRVSTLADRFDELFAVELPLDETEVERLRAFAPRFPELCAELDAFGVPATIQHDDLHGNNLYPHAGGTRILDWGDSSVSHPFFSFVQIFRHTPKEWHRSLCDAYLEPWGDAAAGAGLAIRLSWFAYAIALLRDGLFGVQFAAVLREGLAQGADRV